MNVWSGRVRPLPNRQSGRVRLLPNRGAEFAAALAQVGSAGASPSPYTHSETILETSPWSSMPRLTLAVVSDTHGHVSFTTAAMRQLDRRGPDLVIHCGDVGNPAVLPLFAGRPTHFVLGNCDVFEPALRPAILAAGHVCHDDFGSLNLAGVRVAFLHGHDDNRLQTALRDGSCDLLCHGHTHVRRWETVGRTRVLNPGALFRATPHSLALVRLPELEVEFIDV